MAFINQDQFALSKSQRRRKRDKEQVELLLLEATRRKKSNHFSRDVSYFLLSCSRRRCRV
jgi:hypothetical protein